MSRRRIVENVFRLLFVCLCFALSMRGQKQEQSKISKYERDEVLHMLDTISQDVRKHYYDPKLRGIDWDTNIKNFREKIENVTSLNRGLTEVAAALDVLNDSHTFFLPPPRPYKHDYGWHIQIIGQKCYVTQVRPQSDAETKGMKSGDEMVSMNGYLPARDNLWKLSYLFNVLRPQPGMRLSLLSPTGEKKDVDVLAAVRERPKVRDIAGDGFMGYFRELENEWELRRMRYVEIKEDTMILKFPGFSFSESEVDSMMKKARKQRTLIMDLRGNPGGSVITLNEFLGNMFDHDVKICDRVTRDNSRPLVAKSRGKDAFTGKLIVLVDSRSGSASEVLARVIQIEKRGIVIGDKSAGAVMEARHYQYQIGLDTVLFYGASITDADLIMTDGKSLEGVGVTPDELLVPSAPDLVAGRDPVLAHAVELAGGKITSEAAGKLFPFEWPKD